MWYTIRGTLDGYGLNCAAVAGQVYTDTGGGPIAEHGRIDLVPAGHAFVVGQRYDLEILNESGYRDTFHEIEITDIGPPALFMVTSNF
jgi:hypothetical protein